MSSFNATYVTAVVFMTNQGRALVAAAPGVKPQNLGLVVWDNT